MGCGSRGRWHGQQERWKDQWRRSPWGGSSGNAAFDEYRADTLKRLEEEEKEFRDFLDRLRKAKDKAEFDQFMADRRSKPTSQQSGSENGQPPTA